MTTKPVAPCPNCNGRNLYRSKEVSSGGGHAPNYLPKLGAFWASAKFTVVVCKDCGLTRWFAQPKALAKVAASDSWTSVR